MDAFGASPVKRLETETPSSASRPSPVLARDSMIEASSGRLAPAPAPGRGRTSGTPGRRRRCPAGSPAGWPASCRAPGRSTREPRGCRCRASAAASASSRLQHPLHDGERHTVELDEDDTVDLGVGDLAGLDPEQARREGLVRAGADEPDEQGAEGSRQPGRRDGCPERVERRTRDDVHGEVHHERLTEQRRHRHGEPADGGCDLDEDRAHDQPSSPSRSSDQQRPPRRVGEAWKECGGEQGRGTSVPTSRAA